MSACSECGASIPDGAGFCPGCGKAQEGKPGPSAAERDPDDSPASGTSGRRRATLIGVGALALVLAGGAVAAFLLVGRTARGDIVSLTSDQPIAGATIECISGSARTDDTGRFTLPKLQIGTHDVTVTVAGFAPFKTALQVRAMGATRSRIKLPDASLTVRLEENASQPKPVDSAKVLVGGAAASRVASGTYELKGLRPGTWAITIADPAHESTRTTVDLQPGGNDVDVRVCLTPAETYTRYFQAYRAGQWSAAYAYLHPDIAGLESLTTFTKDMKAWGKPLSMKVDSTRVLPRWTSPMTSSAYKDVAEIRRTLVVEKEGVHYTNTKPQHWVNVGGLWLRVDI